jgi:hypothetical protein
MPIPASLEIQDEELIEELGPNLDFCFGNISKQEKRELNSRIGKLKDSDFHGVVIPPPLKKNNLDIEGYMFQSEARRIALVTHAALQANSPEIPADIQVQVVRQSAFDIIKLTAQMAKRDLLNEHMFAIQPQPKYWPKIMKVW